MHAEKLGNMASAVSTRGGQRIAILLLAVPASPDFRCSSSIAFLYSTDRDYTPGRVNGSDGKG